MIERESDRKDQTSKLGKPLTMGEEQIYRLIHSAGTEPVTVEELYEQYRGLEIDNINDKKLVYQIICRIKQKLGEYSIINLSRPNKMVGYISRRALIEESISLKKTFFARKDVKVNL